MKCATHTDAVVFTAGFFVELMNLINVVGAVPIRVTCVPGVMLNAGLHFVLAPFP